VRFVQIGYPSSGTTNSLAHLRVTGNDLSCEVEQQTNGLINQIHVSLRELICIKNVSRVRGERENGHPFFARSPGRSR
jgi:hypothetical protein